MKKILAKAKNLAAAIPKRRSIPVSQKIINRILPSLIKDPKIQKLEVTVHDGSFTVIAQVKDWIAAEVTAQFEILEVNLTVKEQFVRLRLMNPSRSHGKDLVDIMVLPVVKAIFLYTMKIDPIEYAAQKLKGVTVNEDVYAIDLDVALDLKALRERHPKITKYLAVGSIREIRCIEHAFEVVPSLEWFEIKDRIDTKRRNRE